MNRPKIVCLCGSTKFKEAFQKAMLEESLAGKIVVSVACYTQSDKLNITEEQKKILDELHLRKIDLADEVLILNMGGYIGESTKNELVYAALHHKKLRFLESGVQIDHVAGILCSLYAHWRGGLDSFIASIIDVFGNKVGEKVNEQLS